MDVNRDKKRFSNSLQNNIKKIKEIKYFTRRAIIYAKKEKIFIRDRIFDSYERLWKNASRIWNRRKIRKKIYGIFFNDNRKSNLSNGL